MSIATKVGKNAFAAVSRRLAKTESTYQRKVGFLPHARRRQFRSFILSPSKCKRSTTIHIFSLAVGLLVLAFTNSRRQFGGWILSSTECKRFTTFHIFSLADVGDCLRIGFMRFFGFCFLPYRNFVAGRLSCLLQSVHVRIGCRLSLLPTWAAVWEKSFVWFFGFTNSKSVFKI